MEEQLDSPNYFVRILIGMLSLFIAVMVGYRFFATNPRAEISSGIVTLLCMLIVLILAESFDNFSIGKLLSFSREIEKKEKEVEKLEQEKAHLMVQLISIASNQNQNQNQAATNVFTSPAFVSRATEPEIEAKKTDETVSQEIIPKDEECAVPESAVSATPPAPAEVEPPRVRFNWGKAEEIAFTKYFGARALQTLEIIREVKLTERDKAFDPISSLPIVFDAYFRDGTSENFVEFKPARTSLMFRDRLYVMLSKIYHYRLSNNSAAQLDLVIIKMPSESERVGVTERILRDYVPAIASGLLTVHYVELSEEEAESCQEVWNPRRFEEAGG